MATTNLPQKQIEDSAAGTRLYFDSYGEAPLEYNATEVDACISFFQKRGFDEDAAIVISSALLRQAKIDSTPIFVLLDTLSGFDEIQLSVLVSEVMNNNRTSTSTLGYKTEIKQTDISRNISA
jgi:hypothetical protein